MKWILPVTLICTLLSVQSYAWEVVNLRENPEVARSMSITGYDEIEITNFNDWKKIGWSQEMSSVGLKKAGSEDSLGFYAKLSINSDGTKTIHFITSCNEKRDLNLSYVMKVEDVNITAGNGCSRDGGGTMVEVFYPVSDEAQKFIAEEFRKNMFVKVQMGSTIIPFSAEGFSVAWDRLGDAPL